ncbi:MAG: NAD-dependent epimerase [Pseudomonadota bacterium]
MKTLVTGNAGFIGFHTTKRLLERGDSVVGFDIVNDYYDPQIKEDRLKELEAVAARSGSDYLHVRENLANTAVVEACFKEHRFDRVINLAAQAGVRYSLVNPHAYVESNLVGFTNILEGCRQNQVQHLTYASTSSVYGANTDMPFSERKMADHPVQFYAATKRANELMAHSYSHLYQLPTTGLRFFTVYGPWGRPDMALFLFTKNMLEGRPIQVFNHGKHTRDFTFVDDIVEGVIRASDDIALPNSDWDSSKPDAATSNAPYRLFNIGNNNPVSLMKYIEAIEQKLDVEAEKIFLPLQKGDVPSTFADVSALKEAVGYQPKTPVEEGVSAFVDWYRSYYNV